MVSEIGKIIGIYLYVYAQLFRDTLVKSCPGEHSSKLDKTFVKTMV
jgi:hypothetical protein